MVAVVLGSPFEEVGPAHPGQEVGIPAWRNAHSARQVFGRCAVSPAEYPVGVVVHPSPRHLQGHEPASQFTGRVVDPFVGFGARGEQPSPRSGGAGREQGEAADERNEYTGDSLTEPKVEEKLTVGPLRPRGGRIQKLVGRLGQQAVEVVPYPGQLRASLLLQGHESSVRFAGEPGNERLFLQLPIR